jgi:hypothetical protein
LIKTKKKEKALETLFIFIDPKKKIFIHVYASFRIKLVLSIDFLFYFLIRLFL